VSTDESGDKTPGSESCEALGSKAADLVLEFLEDIDRKTSQQLEDRASKFAREAELEQPINRAPSSIAAGAIYAAGLLENEKLDQATIEEASGVRAPTIGRTYPEILDHQGVATRTRNASSQDDGDDREESATLTGRLKGVFSRG
jgi:hypothetical protein